MKYRIEEIDFPKASDDLLEKFLVLLEELTKEVYPQDPFPSKEKLIRQIRNPNPHYKNVKWLVFADNGNQILGWADLAYEIPESPSYIENSHIVTGRPYVSLTHRRLGIGTALITKQAFKAKELGKTLFETSTIIEAGQRFAEKHGGIFTQKLELSRLYFDDIDWGLVHDLRNEGELKTPTVRIETFNEIPEKDIQQFVELYTETANQAPSDEREGITTLTVDSRRLNEKKLKEQGIIYITMIAREKDGTICGITERTYNKNEPHRVIVGITGVKRHFRNRGIGKRLKVEMLLHLKKTFSSMKYEHTATSTTNASMLSINTQLGYKPFVAGVFYSFKIDDLIKNLNKTS